MSGSDFKSAIAGFFKLSQTEFRVFLFLFAIACFSGQQIQQESKFEPNLTGIKCVVSGKAASEDNWCKFKKGKIFFDCNESRRKFINEKASFIIKANHQLAVTGQYVQVKCPIKTIVIDAEKQHKQSVAGIEILFCCDRCQKQLVEKANVQEQIRFIFDNRKFNAIFQPRSQLAARNTESRK